MPAVFRILLAAISLMAGIGVLDRVRADPIVVPSASGLEKLSKLFEDEVASGNIAGAVVLI